MKKNQKAQISSTLSWFVATIVIFFILIIFVFFANLKTLIDKTQNIANSVSMVKTDAFLKEEQQRGLFVLFEKKTDNKKFYDSLKKIVNLIEYRKEKSSPNKFYLDEESEAYTNLEKTIKSDLESKKGTCYVFYVLNNKTKYMADPSASGGEDGSSYQIQYYFRYPKKDFPQELIFLGDIEKNSYSFFFPEKPFVLIKYILEECEDEKQKS